MASFPKKKRLQVQFSVVFHKKVAVRPVGWSGDGGRGGGGGGGGVRESNKVELIESGGGSKRGYAPSRPARR